MFKLLRWVVIFGVVFGLGYYTGQRPEEVKQTLRTLSGEVLEKTIGRDQRVSLQRQMLEAKEGLLEGRAYLMDHHYQEASDEFGRALRHIDRAVELDPQGPTAQRLRAVKQKVQEAQASLAQGRSLPPDLMDDLRRELQAVMP